MANSYGPQSIVTDGIVFNFDALNHQSYISGSTICRDLSVSPLITGSLSGSGDLPGIDSTNHLYIPGTANDPRFVFIPPGTTTDKMFPAATNQLTFEIWFKSAASTSWSSNERRGIVRVGNDNGSYGAGIGVGIGATHFQWYINSWTTNKVTLAVKKTEFHQKWYHAVMIYDGSDLYSFVNGVKYDYNSYTTSYSTNITTNSTSPTGVGWLEASGDNLYCDILRVYNKPLSDSEVLQNYNSQKARYGL